MSKKTISFFKFTTTLLLVFSFFVSPLSYVLAEETTTLASDQSSTTTVASVDSVVVADPTITTDAPTTPTDTTVVDKKKVIDPQTQSLITQQQDPASIPRSTTKQLLPNTDQLSGALTYSLPIVVPPGRNGLQPDLKLNYNNQIMEDGSVFGLGWSTNIPVIERINRKGSEQLYSQNYFNSSLSGELVLVSGTTWAPKIENGDFITYTFSSNTWTVKDKKGTTYKFGSVSTTRQDDPNDSTRIYRWMLEEVRDTNNNYIKYEYYKDAGQIYPSRIVYTGNNITDGIFEVNFLRQSRTDTATLNKPGFNITSNYRINEINTKVSGVLAHKYTLVYSSGGNGARSILNSVTESGYDDSAVITTLPATTLSYQAQTAGWTSNTNWAIPSRFGKSPSAPEATQVADVNGDGLVDVLFSGFEWSTGCNCFAQASHVWVNNGNGFTLDGSWSIPELFMDNSSNDLGTRIADVNGDGLADIISTKYVYNGSSWDPVNKVYINSGTSWTYDASWVMPIPIMGWTGSQTEDGTRIFDVNGDGLPDIIHAPYTGSTAVYLNNGSGWTLNSSWVMPVRFMFNTTQQNASDIADVNGDGLMDVVFSGPEWNTGCNCYAQTSHVWLNNGNGWTLDNTWSIPEAFEDTSYNDLGVRIADVNSDGLADFLFSGLEWDTGSNSYVWHNRVNINNGHGWTLDNSWSIPEQFVSCSGVCYKDTGVRITDVNGDGIPDILRADWNGTPVSYINNTKKIDSLTQIVGNKGATSTITYKPSTQYTNGSTLLNPKTPLILETVSQISTNDGFGGTSATSYTYAGGKFYFTGPFDRKFSGFNKVTSVDSAGNTTINYYHQGDTTDTANGEYDDQWSKIGKQYRTENYNSSNSLYNLIVNKWDRFNQGTGRDFVKLARATTLNYDGNSSHRDTAEEYVYDNTYGNLITKTTWGEVTGSTDGSFVDTGTDKATETISYVANTGNYVVGLPYDDTVVDQSSNKVNEVRNYYDNLALGSVGVGNPTKVEQWKTASTYINTQKAYNTTYGTVTSSTDERGKVTNYAYDTYNLYPATVTDPMTRTTQYVYDYSAGKPKQVTDQNSMIYQTIFDGLDRSIEEKIPDFTTPYNPVTKTTYTYTDTAGAVKVQKADYLDVSNTIDTYQYFDGLGRLIQERKEAEISGNFNVRDLAYNNVGLLQNESLKYISSGSSRTSATGDSTLYTTYAYDPLQRVASVTNATGVTSYSYDDWKTTITDANGKQKGYYKDAYGNLVRVDEINSGNTYTTTYTWNLNGKLTNITDALSNVRNFTYDGVGRRLTAQDLHASSDTSYGTWTYTYDDAGNITQSLSPLSQTVNYVYDNVNRVTSEDYTGGAGTEITYTYDSCTKGIGKLCTATVASGAASVYTYDALGNIAIDQETINALVYTTSYTYDRQGNTLTITYPDSAQAKYTFNTAGLLEKIERKESGGSFTDVVSNFDYNPMDQVVTQVYPNTVTTTNTYDATKLYRLTRRLTQNTVPSKLQDLNYTYDNVGNITQLVDASNTNSSKTANYTYDDLYRLTGATITAVASGQSTYTHTFTYDALGNILTGPIGTYLYQGNTGVLKANPHAATSINGVTYTYDADGNLTTNGTLTNTWNYRDQITQSVSGGTTVNDYYDAQGNRVRYKVGTTNTYYPNKYYNTDTSKKTKQIFAGDQLVATVETVSAVVTPYYNHTDQLNSISSVSNSSGALVETLDYYPYGDQRISSGTYTGQRQYIGQIYDSNMGLDYLNARFYKANIGRFISEDPVFWEIGQTKDGKNALTDPQSMNSYSYALNNPIIKSDPSGRWYQQVLTGQQSWSSFRNEVGQATNYLYSSSSTWRFGLNHPVATGIITAGVSIPALLAGESAAAAYSMATFPGVSATFSAQQSVAVAVYSGLAVSSTLAVPQLVSKISKVNSGNPSSFYKAGWSVTKEIGPSIAGGYVGAVSDAAQFGSMLGRAVTRLISNVYSPNNVQKSTINKKLPIKK